MSSVAGPAAQLRAELHESLTNRSRWEIAEHVAIVALLMWWAVPFTRATGGRGVHNELMFAALLVVLLVATRAWRASLGSLLAAAAVAVAALLICVFAPTHWYGSDVASGYVIAGAVFVVARRYVRDGDRRNLIGAAVCLAGVYQFALAFQPWWGGEDSSVEMSGTFYWHNPYAAFLLPGVIVGLALVAEGRKPWNLVGWISLPLCAAGIVFSSSRATLAAAVVGLVVVAAASFGIHRGIRRASGGLLAAAVVVAVLPGPPLFPSYHAPWSAAAARVARGQSLAQNGHFRTEFWRAAFQDAIHHPAVGTGYHALASAAAFYTPSNWARSPLAHDGYLQALSDGGLLLGVPFLLVVAIVAWWAFRRLWTTLPLRKRASGDLVGFGLAVALLGTFGHSAVDFDWSHPAILAEVALLAATVAPMVAQRPRNWHLAWAFVPFAAMLAALSVCLPALHQWQIDQPSNAESTNALLAQSSSTFGDYRPARTVLQDWQRGGRQVAAAQLREALDQTQAAAKVDLDLALLRYGVGARSGLIPQALAKAEAQLNRVHGSHAPWTTQLFQVYLGAGERAAAQRLLRVDIASQAAAHRASPILMSELSLWAENLGTGVGYACELRLARGLASDAELGGLPVPTAFCPRDHQAGA